jgi:hypothetical protein
VAGPPLPASALFGAQREDGIGEMFYQREVMEHAENGARTATCFLFEHRQDTFGEGGVEVRDGFIGQDQFRLLDERAGDGDALLFTARQATDKAIAMLAQSEGIQATVRAHSFRGGEPGECPPPRVPGEGASQNILKSGSISRQVQLLKDEPYARAEIDGVMKALLLATIGDRAGIVRAHSSQSFE